MAALPTVSGRCKPALVLLLAHLDVAPVDGAANRVAASGRARQVELVRCLADMRLMIAEARSDPFKLAEKMVTIFVRQGDVLRAAVPFSIVLDANAEARDLAIEQALRRKLDRVGARLHRPALIADAA